MDKFLGTKLRLARNFHGMTLEDLGNQVAATRQYIQQIEVGAKQPAEDMVLALAAALGVNQRFFYTHGRAWASEELCHFRSLRTAPVNTKNQALSKATVYSWLVDELEQYIDFPSVDIPNENVNSLEDIEQAAERARAFWQLGDSGPITNMVRVAENAGIVVAYFDEVSEKIDAFSMHSKRPIIVRNPYKESVCRMRFDIAHECGHLIMHQGIVTGDKKTEDQANRFASAFLLPREAFIREFPRSEHFDWHSIYNLKIRWRVSVAAIIRRSYDLGIIDAAAYRRACVHLSKTGQSKLEKYDDRPDVISTESPEMIFRAFDTVMRDAPHLILSLAESLGIGMDLLGSLVGRDFSAALEAQGYSNVIPLPSRGE